jgi:proline dehydrogenase
MVTTGAQKTAQATGSVAQAALLASGGTVPGRCPLDQRSPPMAVRLRRRALFRLATFEPFEAAVRRLGLTERVARRLALRYVAGTSQADALRVAAELHAQGLASSVDVLGEAVTDQRAVHAATERYVALAQALRQAPEPVWLAIDLSHVGLDLSDALCRRSLERIVAALPPGRRLQVSAQDAARNRRILPLVRALAAEGAPLTATVQANLRSSEADALSLADAGVPVRLVKGAYLEAAALARPWGEATDVAYLRLAHRLHGAGASLALATHDPVLREALLAALGPLPVEVLLGVRPDDGRDLVARGVPVRVYVPFGEDWFRYWLRRVAESQGA